MIDTIKPLHGIRGAAAMTVVIGHFGIVNGAPSLGVVLFFVLSGFLIGKLYLERPFRAGEVWSYAVNRIARVYPLFAVVIVGVALLNERVPEAGIFALTTDQVAPHLLLYGSAMTVWTICAEFQFYALFILIWMLRSRARSAQWILLPLLVLSSGYALARGVDAGRVDIFSYLHVFTLGLLMATIQGPVGDRTKRWAGIALPAFIALYAAVFLGARPFYIGQGIYTGLLDIERALYINPLALLACAGLLWASLNAADSWVNRVLSLPPAYWLGEISFGIYLLHRPAGWLVDTFLSEWPGLVKMPLRVGLTLLFAQIAFWIIERPCRDAIRRLGQMSNAGRQAVAGAGKI